MTVEDRVTRILAEMGEDVRPLPDPYGRVRAGLRRQRRRRLVGAGLAMVTLLSVTGVAVAGGGDGRHDDHGGAEPGEDWRRVVAWTWRLADSPPRGAVAADAGYVATLADLVLQRQRRGEIGAVGRAFTEARVLFVDDVGAYRIGLVALVRADPQPNFWPHGATWLVAPKGASAAQLAAGASGVGDGLEPYTEFHGAGPVDAGEVQVAVAPAECAFESAAWPSLTDWRPEPTGSYLVRTERTRRPEWWRVTCGGVVREQKPSHGRLVDGPLTAAQLAQATATVRHGPEPAAWQDAITGYAADMGYALAGLPRGIWGGRISGTTRALSGSYDGTAKVLAARAAGGGGWLGYVQITYDTLDPATNSTGRGLGFATGTDPTDPSTVVAIPVGDEDPTPNVLVIAPVRADRVVAVRGGREVATARVVDGAALLVTSATADLEVRALDAAGVVLDTTGVAGRPSVRADSSWHQ